MARNAYTVPLGIKILSILLALGLIQDLFQVGQLFTIADQPAVPGWIGYLAFGLLIFTLAKIPMIFGLLTRKSWAWSMAMVLFGLTLVVEGILFMRGDAMIIFDMIISMFVLIYVYSKGRYYGKHQASGNTRSVRTRGHHR